MITKTLFFFEKLAYTSYGIVKILKGTTFRQQIKKQSANETACYILGNGPSLHKDIEKCKLYAEPKNLIAVNRFASSDLYTKLMPNYYVLADPAFYIDSFDPKLQASIQHFFVDLNEKSNWPMTLFVPFEGQKKIQFLLKNHKNITITGFNKVNTWKGFKWFDRWVYNHQWAVVSGYNVIMTTIHIAIAAGFNIIYLLGVDHTWHKNVIVGEDNLLYEYDTHFYDTENIKLTPVLVEEPDNVRFFKLHELFHVLNKTFETYHYIEDYAKYKKVKIFNCTADSYIDAFERIKYLEEEEKP